MGENNMRVKKFLLPCLAITNLLATGCGLFTQKPDIAIIRDQERFEVKAVDIAAGTAPGNLKELKYLHEYAILSANIYGDARDNETVSAKEFCQTKNLRYHPPAWSRLSEIPPFPETPPGHLKIKGLEREVWIKKSNGLRPLALIVFRGTDFKQLGDWFSNFRWVTRFIPLTWDQYDQTRSLVPELVENIRKHAKKKYGEEPIIISAGHSLGGGLAQQAGYISKHIKKVYAFDASVVTGYYSVNKADRNLNKMGMKIYRIYEHGEILAYLRLFMKLIFPVTHENPQIVEIRYNLGKGNLVSQHSMKKFACELLEIFDTANPQKAAG